MCVVHWLLGRGLFKKKKKYVEVWFCSGIVPTDQKMIATEKIVCDSSQEKRGSHPVQGHLGKYQGQLGGEAAREKHGQKPLFWFSKEGWVETSQVAQW